MRIVQQQCAFTVQETEDGQDELHRNSNSEASASHAPEQANRRGSVSSQARAVPVSGHACAIQQVCMCHTRQSIPYLMVRSQKEIQDALFALIVPHLCRARGRG